jgi:hypothetical protein
VRKRVEKSRAKTKKICWQAKVSISEQHQDEDERSVEQSEHKRSRREKKLKRKMFALSTDKQQAA